MMYKIQKGQPPLSSEELAFLKRMNQKHLSLVGTGQKGKFAFDEIREVKRLYREKAFKVVYGGGEWYHYGLNGEIW